VSHARRTRFALKIQEGCDFRCSYCIVPSVRGQSRSVPPDGVVALARTAIDAGYHELVVTGTHIGQYGPPGLVALVKELAGLDGDFRLRLSSLDPRDLDDDLLELICSHPRLCRHLHVSCQSLCDPVLAAMRRGETAAETIVKTLSGARAACPSLSIGADIIVGFPTESLAMFGTTLENIERIGLSYGHVFRFSPRPGTEAATMSTGVREAEKTRRSEECRCVVARSRHAFIAGLRGTRERIVVESESPPSGLTSNYLRAEAVGACAARNEWLDIVIDSYDPVSEVCGASRE
jgi:threonylcarbamoyladenosine tRNA methylthiotransferase MtaB